ncbi:hypothetical protein M9458_054040 [Cirrhinus mrigala]|uniref:THAP domain containing 9 n=1 Tax=Cirrhinus mrigala TaxID=683832 RepID=A0ABD0MKF5_CIRMR
MAYKYVRETLDLGLPHPSTIRRWYRSNGGDPGFSKEVLASLQIKAAAAQAGKKMLGYVDIGTKIESENIPIATEVLVLMVVCIHDHWKAPVVYFLTHGMTGSERATLVRQCILKLSDVGVKVVSLTCDGPSTHFSMLKDLGADLQPTTLNTSFPNPSNSHRSIHVILDVCHMLKLVRNTLGSCGIIVDPCGNRIKWEYIKFLHNLQKDEGLHLGNKLRSAHIDWQTQKMKVNLAAQTISTSVADALRFCERHLQLPQFAGCEPTCKFLEIFDRLFDMMNSRNPFARGLKGPLRHANERTNMAFLMEAYNYIIGLKEPGITGRPLVATGKKTAFLGFLVAIKSFKQLYDTCETTNITVTVLTDLQI